MPSKDLAEVEACMGEVWAEQASMDMRRRSLGRPTTPLAPPGGGVLTPRGVSCPLSPTIGGSSCPGAVSTLTRF